jgi:hypothetical protein
MMLFAIPLTVIKKQPLIQALSSANTMAAIHWKKIVLSYGLLSIPSILVFISILLKLGNKITMGLIGLMLILSIWILPMVVTLIGVLFRDAYRLKSHKR